jgi:hypothetical protein
MNKTIIINISGVIFHIEEDAYEILKTYMNEVKQHFASYKDNFEIITDIENRIAEMFSDLMVKENKQVIVLSDVDLSAEWEILLILRQKRKMNNINLKLKTPPKGSFLEIWKTGLLAGFALVLVIILI